MASKKLSSKERMKQAEQWCNYYQPNGNKFNLGNFQKNLENGIALGYVAMGIDSNLAAKHFKKKDLQSPKIGPFPNKVRITAFVSFCKSYGCDERDVFRTVYLAEPKDQKDLDNVVRTLENLSSLIESKGGNQSKCIGIQGRKQLKKSANKDYQKAQSQSVDSYGIVKHPNVSKSSWTAKQYDATHKSKPKNASAAPPKKVNTSQWQSNNNNNSFSKPKPNPAPVKTQKWGNKTSTSNALWGNKNTNNNSNASKNTSKGTANALWGGNKKKASSPAKEESKQSYKSGNQKQGGLTGVSNPNQNKSFGFSAEQQSKQASKYSADMERQVVAWVNKVCGGAQGGGAAKLQGSLKNGVVLCKLMNAIKPGCIKPKIMTAGVGKSGAMANFADKQRINEFSKYAKQMGLPSASSFEADDLWEGKNMTAVLVGLYGFGVVCNQKKYGGAKGGIVGKGKNSNRGGSLYN